MVNYTCRVCSNFLFDEPILKYNNMPSIAQNFPTKEVLDQDKPASLSVCQCPACGLVQLNSDPVPYYKEVIRASGCSEEMKSFRKQQFTQFVKDNSLSGKNIVEIGCGKGEYLEIMNETEANVFGIEWSDNAVLECKGKDLKVAKNFLDFSTSKIDGGLFDGFFMLSFLEHLPDPNSTIKGIYHNLNEGGVGIIEVPNFDMILKENLFSEFMTDHLFYFTKDTLKLTLELNGFEVLTCKVVWHDYLLSAVVRKRKKLDLSSFLENQNTVIKSIESFITEFQNIAIWGAGHQALAIMAIADLGTRINYVVDSAPFKQNKYTPSTHIPIVSPEELRTNPVDAIIVMCGSYSNEIVNLLHTKYPPNLKIGVLESHGIREIKR